MIGGGEIWVIIDTWSRQRPHGPSLRCPSPLLRCCSCSFDPLAACSNSGRRCTCSSANLFSPEPIPGKNLFWQLCLPGGQLHEHLSLRQRQEFVPAYPREDR